MTFCKLPNEQLAPEQLISFIVDLDIKAVLADRSTISRSTYCQVDRDSFSIDVFVQ